jgi:hypothetical protein
VNDFANSVPSFSLMEKLERGQEQAASVIEVLADNLDRLAQKVENVTAPSPYRKRRIGYIIDDD